MYIVCCRQAQNPDSSRYCGVWTVPGNAWTVPVLATLPLDPIQKSVYSDIVYCILYTVGTHRARTVPGIAPTVRGGAAVQPEPLCRNLDIQILNNEPYICLLLTVNCREAQSPDRSGTVEPGQFQVELGQFQCRGPPTLQPEPLYRKLEI